MNTLIGRDAELRQIQHYLDRAKNEPVAGSLCLSGTSGIGKSAILETAAASAANSGWLVVVVACHAIQTGLPFAVARRAFQGLLKILGEDCDQYTSGLGDTNNPDLEAMLPGLIEGIAFDKPVLLVIDDLQWIDSESARLFHSIVYGLSDRPLVVVAAAQRSGDAPSEGPSFDSNIAIGELRPQDARKVVETIYPDADAAIIDEIFAHAAGNTIDLIALAEAARENASGTVAQVASSLRNVVANRVKSLERSVREFLQLCSIIPEPIEYEVLNQIFQDERQLTNMIERVTGRYLVLRDDKLNFAHRAISTAVRETIPVEIPLRRRVIAALEGLPFQTMEHRFHIAEQALACGDQSLAHTYFLALAHDGTERNLARIVIEASQAALEIGAPPTNTMVQFYADYAKALNSIGRFTEAIEILENAIQETARTNGQKSGELILQLIIAQCLNDDLARAKLTCARYTSTNTDAHDREFIAAGTLWFAVCEANDALSEEVQQSFSESGGPINPENRLRFAIASAYLASRRGDYAAAISALDQATQEVRSVNSPVRNILDATATFVDFDQYGTSAIEHRVPDLLRKFSSQNDSVHWRYLVPYGALLSGNWVEGESSLHSTLSRGGTQVGRLRFLSLVAMVGALRGTESAYDEEIEREGQHFSNGSSGAWYIPLATWWSARIANTQPEQATRLFLRALEFCAKPLAPQFRLPLMGFAVAAKRLGRPMLERFIANPPWVDCTRVNQAELKLALEYARDGLGIGEPKTRELAIGECESLGLHLYAMIARSAFSPKESAARINLEKLGIYQLGAKSARHEQTQDPTIKLTTRERHVASVVAEGLTNREIAERLVLSERTIEAHIANIFNKLNVSSRTQIAAWYLRSTAAG